MRGHKECPLGQKEQQDQRHGQEHAHSFIGRGIFPSLEHSDWRE